MVRLRRTWSADKSPIGSAQDIQGSYIRGQEVFKPHHTWDLSKRKWTEDKVLKIVKEYQALVDDAFAKDRMGELPSFTKWVKSNYGSAANAGIFYARRGTPDELFRSITSGDYARDKKIELVRKIIRTNNASLKGGTELGPLLIGTVLPSKVTNVQLRTKPAYPGSADIRVIFSKMQTELDTKHDKVRKALAEILGNKEAPFNKTILQQIIDKTGLDRKTITEKGRPGTPGALAKIPEWNKVGSFVKGIPDKEIYDYIGAARSKIGGTYTLGEMLQIGIDNKIGKGAGFTDWEKVAGDNPSQYAVRTAGREWIDKKGKGKITFYDKNLNKIEWPKKFSTQEAFFTYNDPRYANRIYGMYKPGKKALENLSKKFPGHTIHALKADIRNLPEWKEVVDIVQAKRDTLGAPEKNPFTGETQAFKKVADDIGSRILKSSKGEFFKPGYYTVGIDHKVGMGESLFNDFRLVTARDNSAFYQIKSNPALRGIATQLEESIFSPKLEGNISGQQKAIREFYKNVGDRVVKASAEGRTSLMPTAHEEAAYSFLKKGKYTQAEGAALEKISAPMVSLYNQIQKSGKDKAAIEVLFGCRPPGAAGGRVSFADGNTCVWNKIKNQPLESSQKIVAGIEEGATGVLGKIRNTASGFLGALGKFGPAAGKFGAIAAVGALAQPLVKQFMNDDPSTYLTDPDQQAGMLEALIEGERPKPRSEILDWGVKGAGVGATAAAVPGMGALYKARRLPTLKRAAMGPLRAGTIGPAMKLISGMYTPAGLLAMEPLRIAQMRREGESWGEVAKSPTLWMGPAFASGMTRMATRGMKPGSTLAKALSLGMSRPMLKTVSRRFGMPGLALSLGLSGYDMYKDYKKKRGFFAKD